ncbi:prolyl oligopeptidase family serine peptidase [Niabella yanshanensis]|uniref:Prolyl oligopeptidase family serine peptidase n=1 Tax=Niabella yanshanensis TaxID=577386 RepID=A0ABZ0W7B0_9BACT|nr:prolyl oligopeptidase family serine peptidase [Niabella yanshanensis]WQD39081.1 prolyl oligopeptidase family serine peptidase [Niabella yanshanensis]
MKLRGVLALLLLAQMAAAQDTIRFDKALAVQSGSRYGREAIYTDWLSYQLFHNLLQPAAGTPFSKTGDGDSIVWRTVTADENGRFRVFSRRNFQRSNNPFLNPGAVDRGADYLYITYNAPQQQAALLRIQGSAGLYVNGAPHMGDPYSAGYMHIPVLLKKGRNEIYIRGANVLPELIPVQQALHLHTDDVTAPHIVLNKHNSKLKVALVVSNAGPLPAADLSITSTVQGKALTSTVGAIPGLATRKIFFEVDASAVKQKGNYDCALVLKQGNKTIHSALIILEAVQPNEHYSSTFISGIDGSLQYYATTPQSGNSGENQALFLSVHGAGVEAIGQARAYKPKDWGNLVAATNRRPRGFNWEDWGRLDAMEVLQIAKDKFKPDPSKIYLTGHSMGGHGTWFLGATYPDKWAAIGPAAGYASLKDYGSADGRIPDSARTEVERLLLRSGNQSDVPKLANNYQPLGVYILHGDSDRVVPVTYARQMRKVLGDFHKDFSYYEYPGGEHWFGDQSVDWPPMFDYFKWHQRQPDSLTNTIDFTTSSPGISATHHWATIYQQQYPLQYSRIQLSRNRASASISGATQNVALLQLSLNDFPAGTSINIRLDSTPVLSYTTLSSNDNLYLGKTNSGWAFTKPPVASDKNPLRYGTFKEAFNKRMVFVVGTRGTAEENQTNRNKAIYDAESWYYRGNGAVDIISDTEYQPSRYAGRNIIIYGNADNNNAWKMLLSESPLQVKRNQLTAGDQKWTGDNLATYFVWPQKDPALLVGVIAATGVKGMKAAYANQYFAGGSGFPDFMIFSDQMLKDGAAGVKLAGFFDNHWRLTKDEMAASKD